MKELIILIPFLLMGVFLSGQNQPQKKKTYINKIAIFAADTTSAGQRNPCILGHEKGLLVGSIKVGNKRVGEVVVNHLDSGAAGLKDHLGAVPNKEYHVEIKEIDDVMPAGNDGLYLGDFTDKAQITISFDLWYEVDSQSSLPYPIFDGNDIQEEDIELIASSEKNWIRTLKRAKGCAEARVEIVQK